MADNRTDDTEDILTDDVIDESQATLLDERLPVPSQLEIAVLQYAQSIERLIGSTPGSTDDAYTRGFVAGLRAAAKVAANVART
jgi:hypothetical protein